MKRFLSRSITRVRFLWVTLSLVTVTTLILVACGGGGTTATQPTPTPTTAPTATPTSQPSPTPSPTPTVVKVQIVEKNEMYSFQPSTLTIKKGTQVIWTNVSDAPHTVTSDTGAFNTPSSLAEHKTFMMTFTTAGTFSYHCSIHPYMKATIIVTS